VPLLRWSEISISERSALPALNDEIATKGSVSRRSPRLAISMRRRTAAGCNDSARHLDHLVAFIGKEQMRPAKPIVFPPLP